MSDSEDAGQDVIARDPKSRSWVFIAGAFLLVVALVCAVALGRRSSDEATKPGDQSTAKPRALGLVRGGNGETTVGKADASSAPNAMPYGKTEYKLQGALPDLGKAAPVYQLRAPTVDQAGVTAMAVALGITGVPTHGQDAWVVTDGNATLTVNTSAGLAWVSFGQYASGGGSSPGSTGGGVSGSPGVPTNPTEPQTSPSVVPATPVAPDDPEQPVNTPTPGVAPGEPNGQPVPGGPVVDPGLPEPDPGREPGTDPGSKPTPEPEPYTPPVMETPKNLPSAADAERIARELLTKMGVTGDWKVEVTDGGSMGYAVACPADGNCPDVGTSTTVVTSRVVAFHRIVDGLATSGLDWSVEIGDNAKVQGVYGVLATLEKVSDYPLRPVNDVYNDLVNGTGFGGGPVPMGDAGTTRAVGAPDTAVADSGSSTPSSGAVDVPGSTVAEPGLRECPPTISCNPDGSTGGDPPPTPDPPSGAEPMPPETVPGPGAEPQTIVISISGAERGLSVVPAYEGGVATAYLVPTYRFVGTYPDGSAFQSELVAIEASFLVEPQMPTPTPTPLTGSGSGSGQEPATAPPTNGGAAEAPKPTVAAGG